MKRRTKLFFGLALLPTGAMALWAIAPVLALWVLAAGAPAERSPWPAPAPAEALAAAPVAPAPALLSPPGPRTPRETAPRTAPAAAPPAREPAPPRHVEPVALAEAEAEPALDREAEERRQARADRALYAEDDEERGDALTALGLHRDAGSVRVLADAALRDPAAENRHEAVQALWHAAADGLDRDGRGRAALEAALDDPDEDVAALAEEALRDLAALAG